MDWRKLCIELGCSLIPKNYESIKTNYKKKKKTLPYHSSSSTVVRGLTFNSNASSLSLEKSSDSMFVASMPQSHHHHEYHFQITRGSHLSLNEYLDSKK